MRQKLLDRNILIFYVLTIIGSSVFVTGNWILFWLKYMNFYQIGLIDAVSYSFGLLMEVPTGAISDLVGRKKTIIAAMICGFLGMVAIASSNSSLQIFIGFMVAQIGWAFYSGAAEALLYDSLLEAKNKKKFTKILSKSHSFALVSGVISTLIGMILYSIHFRMAYFAWGTMYIVGFIFSLLLTEPAIDSELFTLQNYVKSLKKGFANLFDIKLRRYAILILGGLGLFYTYDWGLVKPAIAIQFGYLNKEQSLIFALSALLGAGLVSLLPKFRRHIGDFGGITLLILIMSFGFLSVNLLTNELGVALILIISLSGMLMAPWMSIAVNKRIDSKYRATTLSAAALLGKIPYAVFAIFAGGIVQAKGVGMMGFVISGLLILTAVYAFLTPQK